MATTESKTKSVRVRYFALLKEERGLAEEVLETSAKTLRDLYNELRKRHGFGLEADRLRVAVGDDFVDFDRSIADNDVVIFVPPVAGG